MAEFSAREWAMFAAGRRSVADDLRRRNALGQYDEAIRIAEGEQDKTPVGDLARIAEGNTDRG